MNDTDIFDDRVCLLGEGPFYDEATGHVGWVDILGSRVLWRDLTRDVSGELTCPAHVGAAIPRIDGGLVLCLPEGPVLRDDDGTLHPLGGFAEADRAANVGPPPTPMRSNDAKPDPVGRLWLGTNAYDGSPGQAALYRLDPGAAGLVHVLGGISNSNGLGWTSDGSVMYYVDSPTSCIDAFDYDPATGTLHRRRRFVEIPGAQIFPDGLCVDAAGGVWVALWGGGAVHRYGPDGVLDRVVELPTPLVTSCAFAGADRNLLIITTASVDAPDSGAGRTYLHQPGDVTGVAVASYAG